MAATVLKVDSFDLSPYLRLYADELDPIDSGRVDPQFAGAAALSEGALWIGDAVANRHWKVPMLLKATSVDAVHQLVRDVNSHLFRCALVEFAPEGAGQSTFFDLETGELRAMFKHPYSRKGYVLCELELWTRPHGHTATFRSLIASRVASGPFAATLVNILGDVRAEARLVVAPSGIGAASGGRFVAFGIACNPSYPEFIHGASMSNYWIGASRALITATGAVASQYMGIQASAGVGAVNIQRGALGDAVSIDVTRTRLLGRSRVFALMRHGWATTMNVGLKVQRPGASDVVTPGPTAACARASGWQVLDLGEMNVNKGPSGALGDVLRVTAAFGLPSGWTATAVASPQVSWGGFFFMPLDTSAGVLVGATSTDPLSIGTGQTIVQINTDSREVAQGGPAGSYYRGANYMSLYRGDFPYVPAVASGAATSAKLVAFQGDLANYNAQEGFSVSIDVRERFSYFR